MPCQGMIYLFSPLCYRSISFCHPTVSIRTAVRPVSAVDISTLERLAQEFFARGLAARMVATYGSAQHRYLTFCEAAGLSPLPLSEGVLYLFVVFLARQGLAHQSIVAYFSSVRNLAIANGDTPVDRDQMPRLQLVLWGVARSPSHQGGTHRRLPLLVQSCISYWGVWSGDNFESRLLWLATCVGYFGFMRAGEFTAIGTPPPASLCLRWQSIQDQLPLQCASVVVVP